MWGKLALLAAGTLMGYLGKKIYDENQNSAPESQDVPRDCRPEDKRDNQETVVIPEAAAIHEPVLVTEPAAAAALKHIYETNGPGKLDWDVSATGQVIAKDGRVEAQDGVLIGLNLDYADLHGVLKLHDLESLSSLKADVCNLEGIDFKNLPSLKELSLSHNYIVDISSLADLKSLTMLNLDWQNGQSCEHGKLESLSSLAGLTNLTKLAAYGNEISDLSPLVGLTALTELDVWDNYEISDLSPLAGLFALTKLKVSFNDISDLSPLAGLTNLTELSASGQMGDGISDLSPLANLTSLTELSLSGYKISTLAPLAGLTNLTNFQVYDAVFSDLSPLAGMEKLTELQINSSAISDIRPLAKLTNLRRLDLSSCTISELGPLAGLVNLNELNLRGNEIIDIRPLSGLTKLTELDIGYNMIRDFSLLGELKKLVSEDSFTNQRKETKEAIHAAIKKEAYEREIGKCPHCKRVIHYPDIEDWEAHERLVISIGSRIYMCHSFLPVYVKSGNCPDCGHLITLQGRFYNWKITGPNDPVSAALHKISGSLS